MTGFERRDVGDVEPAYVFRSPCCHSAEVVPAWAVAFAMRMRGWIRLRCGRTTADPLRPAITGKGCGEPFAVYWELPGN